MAAVMTDKRTCDGCDVCCTTLEVDELGKANGQRCPHLAGEPGHSCSIYAERPSECSGYHCTWVLGYLPDRLKPARCGFVVNPPLPHSNAPAKVYSLIPLPGREQSWRRELGALKRLSASFNMPVIINDSEGWPISLLAPSGRIFHRQDRPDLFARGRTHVGCPLEEFLRDPRTDPVHQHRLAR
jgi:hypothetical protein